MATSTNPIINSSNISLEPTNIIINDVSYPYLIKGKNNLTLSVSGAVAGSGSSIKSYTFSGPSVAITGTSASVSVPSVTNVDDTRFNENERATLTYTVTVTDSQNRSASAQQTIVCYNYKNPYFSEFKLERNGNTLNCTFTPVFSSLDQKNRVRVTIRCVTGETTHGQELTVEYRNMGVSKKTSITLGSETATYQVYAIIKDELGGESRTATKTMYGDSRLMNAFADGSGVAFGKKAETKGLFESRWPMKANGFAIPEIQHGSVEIALLSNTLTEKKIEFTREFSGIPTVIITPQVNDPNKVTFSVYDISRGGFSIWITRTDNTRTTVNWIAMY